MKSALLVAAAVFLVNVYSSGAQPSHSEARALATRTEKLTPDEISQVLRASREALSNKRGGLVSAVGNRTRALDFLFGRDGRLRFVQTTATTRGGFVGADGSHEEWLETTTSLFYFTGQRALACDGSALSDELVLEYRRVGKDWTASPRRRPYIGFLFRVFDVIEGTVAVESGPFKDIDGRRARALVATWNISATDPRREYRSDDAGRTWTPIPTSRLVQSLWIDTESFLPLMWESEVPSSLGRTKSADSIQRLAFAYDDGLVLRRPDKLQSTGCVP